MKRFISIMLAALLFIPVALSGCRGATDNPPTAQTTAQDTTQAATQAATDEKVTVSWCTMMQNVINPAEVEARFEERFPGVDLDYRGILGSDFNEVYNTRVASGDVPDINFRSDNTFVRDFARQGIICEITYEKAKEYAPTIYNAIKEFNTDAWFASLVDGKNYGLPNIVLSNSAPQVSAWRMDFLEQVGITEVPTTLDEAEAVFELIRKVDVNGSGKFDTYGITHPGAVWAARLFENIFTAYGIMAGKWIVNKETDNLEWWIVSQKAKECVEKLADWYAKDYIDPEWVVLGGEWKAKINNGNVVLITIARWDEIQPPSGATYLGVTTVDPNAKIAIGPPLKGPYGDCGFIQYGSYSSAMSFGKHLEKDEEKLNLCLRIVDFMAANTDDNEYIRYGVEGVDWKRDEETGALVNLHMEPDDFEKFGTNAFFSMPGIPSFMARYERNDMDYYTQYSRMGIAPEIDYITWYTFFMNNDAISGLGDYNTPMYTGIYDIILGDKPLDYYDTLYEEWYANGGQTMTDEVNRAYHDGKPIVSELFSALP